MAKGKRHPMEGENLPIRNSTAEFLTFARENGADTIAVFSVYSVAERVKPNELYTFYT